MVVSPHLKCFCAAAAAGFLIPARVSYHILPARATNQRLANPATGGCPAFFSRRFGSAYPQFSIAPGPARWYNEGNKMSGDNIPPGTQQKGEGIG